VDASGLGLVWYEFSKQSDELGAALSRFELFVSLSNRPLEVLALKSELIVIFRQLSTSFICLLVNNTRPPIPSFFDPTNNVCAVSVWSVCNQICAEPTNTPTQISYEDGGE
jgi:hypothetical protein